LRLRVRQRGKEREMQWRVGAREEMEYELKDLDQLTAQQKVRRAAWLKGEAEGGTRR